MYNKYSVTVRNVLTCDLRSYTQEAVSVLVVAECATAHSFVDEQYEEVVSIVEIECAKYSS